MKNGLILFLLTSYAFIFNACETDDVPGMPNNGPEVKLSLSQQVISENGGTSDVIATLSATSTQDVTVFLAIGGTAIGGGVNYDISSEQIMITAGNISNSVTLTAIDDTAKDGNKSVIIDADNVEGGFTDGLQQQTLIIEDDDVPAPISLLINEVLYDPPSGIEGDANGDGTREAQEDEFIEFINNSSQPLNMSGFEIYDDDALAAGTPRHLFPSGTIVPAGKAIVVFGGGSPTGSFGGAIVQTATDGILNMNNSGDFVTVKDASGNIIVTFDIEPLSNNPDESYTRNPDLTGEFEQHATNTSLLFSPGTKIDGSPF
jgi:hypothetical protein